MSIKVFKSFSKITQNERIDLLKNIIKEYENRYQDFVEIITKEIESYGTIKLTNKGREFIKNPHSFMLTEDHDYEKTTKSLRGQDQSPYFRIFSLIHPVWAKRTLGPYYSTQTMSLLIGQAMNAETVKPLIG